jgi:putative membrane protein
MAQSITFQSDPQPISVEQAARRTGTAFQRTRLSADPHLAVADLLRLHNLQLFLKLRDAGTITHAGSASNFGIALVILGILC